MLWVLGSMLENGKTRTNITEKMQNLYEKFQSHGTNSTSETVQVQCFPLYSILLAVNRTTVDFFSLDVEGSELDVLNTIPWHKVDIKVYLQN